MNRRELLAATATASTVLVAGCSGGDGSPTILMNESGANPRDLSIDVGETVTWENDLPGLVPEETVQSDLLHEDADEWEFEATLEHGEEATHTFEEEGLYTWSGETRGEECLCGVVEVGDVSLDDPLPCSPVARGGQC